MGLSESLDSTIINITSLKLSPEMFIKYPDLITI